ncbi:NADP-dependent oxidoreductase [Corynebacterium dentalis]|uniref:NADP-dependent oxidoreductase n=2 Tax=Corynebacteriaceae TaxID=1653 RepID=UPI000C0833C9|nr:NADP-dependent oxidoreductase [Corynebacterium dentalis]MBF0580863.1 NADP-dependent oxidoreductase [Corynebacterium sp. ED61]
MRMFGFSEYGGPEVMQFFDVPRPRPGNKDILIEMRAASVNPADIKVRNGDRRGKVDVEFPMAIGREAAGIVREAPMDSPFHAGQLVFGSTSAGTGAMQQFVLLNMEQSAVVPRGLAAGHAACIPVAFGTAWDALHELDLAEEDTVLVNGAGGGVGSASVQLARVLGFRVVGIASSAKKGFVEELGATFVPYDANDWTEQLDSAAEQFHAVVDAAGGETLRRAATLVPQGQIRSAADQKLAEQLGGSGITRRRNTAVFEELADLMAEGKINAHLRRTYSMDDAAQAVADVETGHAQGKTVVTLPGQPV